MRFAQLCMCCIFFFFKQKTPYELLISHWCSNVCSSDLSVNVGSGVSLDTISGRVAAGRCARAMGATEEAAVDLGTVTDHLAAAVLTARRHLEIGRASCRDRVCQ